MYKLLIILLLITGQAFGQRFFVERVGNRNRTGRAILSEKEIKISLESSILPLLPDSTSFPVTAIEEDKDRTFYIIEGSVGGTIYRGSAVLYATGEDKLHDQEKRTWFRKRYALRIEIRTNEGYYTSRYTLYQDTL